MEITEKQRELNDLIQSDLVSISTIGEGYGKWQPSLYVDKRLYDRLTQAIFILREAWGYSYKLPVSSCYRMANIEGQDYDTRDMMDARGHWSGLAIDLGYQNTLSEERWGFFIVTFSKCGLSRIFRDTYKEWWHFSRYGKYVENHPELWEWRPSPEAVALRREIIRLYKS
jgi:hypothetical protein